MIKYAVKAAQFQQYDGTNGAAIATMLDANPVVDATVLTDSGTVLTVGMVGYGGPAQGGYADVLAVNKTDWVTLVGDSAQVITNADFTTQWIVKA